MKILAQALSVNSASRLAAPASAGNPLHECRFILRLSYATRHPAAPRCVILRGSNPLDVFFVGEGHVVLQARRIASAFDRRRPSRSVDAPSCLVSDAGAPFMTPMPKRRSGATTIRSPGPGEASASIRPSSKSTTCEPPGPTNREDSGAGWRPGWPLSRRQYSRWRGSG